MKTFSETSGRKAFDWNDFLNKSKITNEEWKKAKEDASSWVTCACGNQCDIIPRNNNGRPVDSILSNLGGSDGFFGAIMEKDKKLAKVYLKKIEIRSTILIKIEVDKAKAIVDAYSQYI